MFKPRVLAAPKRAVSTMSESGKAAKESQFVPGSDEPLRKKTRKSRWGSPLQSSRQSQRCDTVELGEPNAPASSSGGFLALEDKGTVDNIGVKPNAKTERGDSDSSEGETLPLAPGKMKTPRTNIVISLSCPGLADLATEGKSDAEPAPSAAETNVAENDGHFGGGISCLLNNRYRTMARLGRGVFASVFLCKDLKTEQEVAVKILKISQSARRSGVREISVLQNLYQAPVVADGASHGTHFIVRPLDDFDHVGHTCIVMERMYTSMREVCKGTSRTNIDHNEILTTEGSRLGPAGGGVYARYVMNFSRQILEALRHLHSLGYVHADLKPDNVLINEEFNHCKLCDFGSVIRVQHESTVSLLEGTAYIASRFYRAPEVAIGYGSLTSAVDIWALGVTMAELLSGQILFRGKNNNELMWSIINVLGAVPESMSSSCRCRDYFGTTEDAYFNLLVEGPLTPGDVNVKGIRSVIAKSRPSKAAVKRNLLVAILPPVLARYENNFRSTNSALSEEYTFVISIRDLLLNKLLVLDPARRPTANQAALDPLMVAATNSLHLHVSFEPRTNK